MIGQNSKSARLGRNAERTDEKGEENRDGCFLALVFNETVACRRCCARLNKNGIIKRERVSCYPFEESGMQILKRKKERRVIKGKGGSDVCLDSRILGCVGGEEEILRRGRMGGPGAEKEFWIGGRTHFRAVLVRRTSAAVCHKDPCSMFLSVWGCGHPRFPFSWPMLAAGWGHSGAQIVWWRKGDLMA